MIVHLRLDQLQRLLSLLDLTQDSILLCFILLILATVFALGSLLNQFKPQARLTILKLVHHHT